MSLERYPYVVVFLPAYNEENSIGAVIDKIRQYYTAKNDLGYWVEIIVVDDGSTDHTAQVAREKKVKAVISHPVNQGLGAATRTAMKRAYEIGAHIAVKIDADFQHDPEDIDKVVRPILEDKADCVFGTRFGGGLKYKMPLYRSFGNKFFTWIVRTLTGLALTDTQTGLMAFSRRYLADFEIISNYNETQQLVIDSWGRHMRVVEVPVSFHQRTTGRSFISWKYPFKVLPTIVRLFVHIEPLRIFLPLGFLIIFLGLVVGLLNLRGYHFFGDVTIAICFIGGIQIIIFALLADLVSKKR